MAVLGWKQTNKVASTMSPQIATAILLVINPLRPLKETGCLLRFLDRLQELFLAFLVDPIYASTGFGVYINGRQCARPGICVRPAGGEAVLSAQLQTEEEEEEEGEHDCSCPRSK
jgi:hypothetical protein